MMHGSTVTYRVVLANGYDTDLSGVSEEEFNISSIASSSA